MQKHFYLIPAFLLLLLIGCSKSDKTDNPDPDPEPTCETNGFYIDASSGDDTNAGTSDCEPWQTLAKASNSSFSPGDTIYLKRGETWFEQLSLSNSNVSIDAYGNGSLPTIDGSVIAENWSNEGNGIYSSHLAHDSTEGLGNISEDGVMMAFVAWAGDAATTLESAADGSFSYDYFAQTIYIKSNTDPSVKLYRASKKFFGIRAIDINNITIENIHITRFSLHGIEFKNCRGCAVSNSQVDNGGGTVITIVGPENTNYLYAGNGIEFGLSSTETSIDTVTVSNIFDSCISPQTYDNQQIAADQIYTNMTLARCGFAGVEISVLSNDGRTGSTISNISITNSNITAMGKGWSGRRYGSEGHGIRIQADVGAGSIANSLISQTSISGVAGDGIRIVGDTGTTTVRQTSITASAGNGIRMFSEASGSSKLQLNTSLIYNNGEDGLNYNCPDCQGLNIYHNTFYDNSKINLAIFGQSNEALIKNNLFFSSTAMTHLYVSQTLAGGDVDHNCYNDSSNLFGYNDTAYSTVVAFNNGTGFEVNGLGNGTVGLTEPENENFTLTSNSSCKNMGIIGIGISSDYAGENYNTPPSAGAYQF